jgi:hypothetical protein
VEIYTAEFNTFWYLGGGTYFLRDVQIYREAECVIDHYLVVVKVTKKKIVSRQMKNANV